MKSETQSEASNEAHGVRTADSVFDFLYHDGRRVASFLSQFDPSGSLTQISQGVAAERTRLDTKVEGSASVPGLAKGVMSSKDEVRNRRQDDMMRVYDPMWANARALLDVLDERGMIQRDLKAAIIGQIVLVSKAVDVIDVKITSGLWNSGSVRKMIRSGLPQRPKISKAVESTPAGKKVIADFVQAEKAAKDGVDFFMELAPSLPHSTQAVVKTEADEQLWCSIDPSGLSMLPSDILLKHGITVPGIWSILGTLDATPEPMEQRKRKQTPSGEEMIAKLFETLAPVIRTFFGLSERVYGITPLLIFRETSAPSA